MRSFAMQWIETCTELGNPRAGQLWPLIESVYANPLRFYHNLDHISNCLATLDSYQYRTGVHDSPAIRMALMLHDFVYDVRSKQNEMDSATIADAIFGRWEIGYLIMATHEDFNPKQSTEDHFIVRDIDRSILAGDPALFAMYEDGIRREYSSIYTEALWRQGRKLFLEKTLAKPIFYSVYFRSYEQKARKNIADALAAIA